MSINIYPTRTRCRTCSTILPKSVLDYQIRNRSSSSTRSNLSKEQQPSSSSAAAIIVVGGGPIRRRRSSGAISLPDSNQITNNAGQDKKTWEQQLRSITPAPQPRQKKRNDSTQAMGSSACKTLEELMQSSSSFISTMKNRKSGIQRIKTAMKSRYCIEGDAFDEAISLADKTVFIHLLQQQLASKRISLKLAAKILPEIRFLLSHKNSNFVDTALDILDVIVTHLKESILEGLESNAQSIGVDVAAEDRQILCIKCKKALTEIYVNYHVLAAKLNDERHLYFNSIVEKFMDLVS